MAPKKYMKYDSTLGHTTHEASIDTSAGAGDAGKIVALDANGRIATNMMPTGFGDETDTFVTSENLVAGNLVNIYNNGGVWTARKADGSTTGKQCDGFVLAATTSPAAALVYFDGHNTGCSALVAGPVYLSQTTPGLATSTKPDSTITGSIGQRVGTSASVSILDFEAQEPIGF